MFGTSVHDGGQFISQHKQCLCACIVLTATISYFGIFISRLGLLATPTGHVKNNPTVLAASFLMEHAAVFSVKAQKNAF